MLVGIYFFRHTLSFEGFFKSQEKWDLLLIKIFLLIYNCKSFFNYKVTNYNFENNCYGEWNSKWMSLLIWTYIYFGLLEEKSYKVKKNGLLEENSYKAKKKKIVHKKEIK